MSVLGFSHIVTEVKEFEPAIAFYRTIGYEPLYKMEQEVPLVKQKILEGHPSKVDLLYLKHHQSPRLGIELIRHDKHAARVYEKTIAYGWTEQGRKGEVFVDPERNKVCVLDDDRAGQQHLFLPTDHFEETVSFYQRNFYLQPQDPQGSYGAIYKGLFGDVRKSQLLKLTSCLTASWNACLHVCETSVGNKEKYLNHYGFSCFCFLIDQAEYLSYERSGLDRVGPLEGYKDLKGVRTDFEFGFIRDPNGFFVEFYAPQLTKSKPIMK